MQNFPQQLQTPISKKQKIFPGFEHFEKKDGHPSLLISEIIDSERVGYLNG